MLFAVLLASACGDRFDYRHRYVGPYVLTDDEGQPIGQGSSDEMEVFMGNEDEMVFHRGSYNVTIVLSINKKGELAGIDGNTQLKGSFLDKDHFKLSFIGRFDLFGVKQEVIR